VEATVSDQVCEQCRTVLSELGRIDPDPGRASSTAVVLVCESCSDLRLVPTEHAER
jgi:RNase P subunit RPR2